MGSQEQQDLITLNKQISLLAFTKAVKEEGLDQHSLHIFYLNYTEICEEMYIQNVILTFKEIDDYIGNTDWAETVVSEAKSLLKTINTQTKNIIEKMEMATIAKSITENIDFMLGKKSSPHLKVYNLLKVIKQMKDNAVTDQNSVIDFVKKNMW